MHAQKLLRIASLPPFHIISKKWTTSAKNEVSGFFEYMFAEIVSQKLRLPFEIVRPSDNRHGTAQPDGNFSGMVGMLQRDEADLGIYVLSLTEERAGVIDFSYPYYIDRVVFATRNLERSPDDESFLKPFSVGVWISVFVCILLLPVLYAISCQRKLKLSNILNAYRSFFRTSVSTPQNFRMSLLRACWVMPKALLYWSYTAVLLSALSIPLLSGVRNVPELADAIRQGKYMCTAHPGTFFADALLSSVDKHLKTIGQCLKENEAHADVVAVLSELEFSKKPAYIGTELFLSGLAEKYLLSKDGFFPIFFAIGVKKDFCCKVQLDSTIHRIWASGIYNKLIDDYLHKEVSEFLWRYSEFHTDNDEMSLSLVDFEGVFFLLAIGYFFSTVVCLVELIYAKSRVKFKAHNQN